MAATAIVVAVGLVWFAKAVERQFESLAERTLEVTRTLESIRFNGLRIVSSTNEYIAIVKTTAGTEANEEAKESKEEEAREGEINLRDQGVKDLTHEIIYYEKLLNTYFPDEIEFLQNIKDTGYNLISLSQGLVTLAAGDTPLAEVFEAREVFETCELKFLRQVAAALAHENDEYAEAKEQIHDTINALVWAIWVGLIGVSVFVLIFGTLTARSITVPLAALLNTSREIAAGRISNRVTVSATGEIGELSRGFNDMVDSLEHNIQSREEIGDELKQLNETLEVRIAERTALLEDAVDRAEAANQAKSNFLSSMSHELRTPLNAILGFAQMLEIDDDEPLTENQQISSGQILESGAHLLRLIEDILDFAMIAEGKFAIRAENLHLTEVLDTSLRMTKSMANALDVRIGLPPVDVSNIWARGDRTRLTQCIVNFISNGVQYNHPGGAVEIDVMDNGDGRVRVSVQDTGNGIPRARHDEIFRPFSRLGAENSNIEGSGIGLAVTKQLIEMMGGTIGFESEVGKGSTFWITIPLSES